MIEPWFKLSSVEMAASTVPCSKASLGSWDNSTMYVTDPINCHNAHGANETSLATFAPFSHENAFTIKNASKFKMMNYRIKYLNK
jgi:hypothetical protein